MPARLLSSLSHDDHRTSCYNTTPCRYDLSHVDVVEAVAAEGLATFGGCLPDAAARQLEQLLLAALRNGLGYRGRDMPPLCHVTCLHCVVFTSLFGS
jgi:hypothetical protein